MRDKRGGRTYSSKKEEQEAHKMLLWIVLAPFGFCLFWLILSNTALKDFKAEQVTSEPIDTCAEAQAELRSALDARDAITPSEAMTSVGRKEWEKWRDRGMELEDLATSLCPPGEPLL